MEEKPEVKKPHYLKNNGKMAVITVATQPVIQYYDKRGTLCRIEVVMYREDVDDKRMEEFRLAKFEKCIIHYENGAYKKRSTIPVEHTFRIESYPHLFNVHIGTSKYDERVYNFKTGEIVQVDREDDLKELFEKHHLLDEVDAKGNIINENRYSWQQHQAPQKMDMSDPVNQEKYRNLERSMVDIPIDSPSIKRTSPRSARFWRNEDGERKGGLIERKDLSEE